MFFCVIVISAANYSESSDADADYTLDESTKQYTALLPNYKYPPQPNLPYPTCRLKKGFGSDIELQDFAFISKVAYVDDTKAQEYLDIWFGDGEALVNTELVAEFKESSAYIYDFGTAVSYKLITFPGSPQQEAALSIRGTQTIFVSNSIYKMCTFLSCDTTIMTRPNPFFFSITQTRTCVLMLSFGYLQVCFRVFGSSFLSQNCLLQYLIRWCG